MRDEPIISAAWIKAALVLLVAGALGVGGYLVASGADIDLPDLDLNTTTDATTIENTTLQDTIIGQPAPTTPKPKQPEPAQPAPPAAPSVQQLQQLNRCIQSAGGDIDRITACFERFTN